MFKIIFIVKFKLEEILGILDYIFLKLKQTGIL